MTTGRALLIALAGVGAGVVNGVAGGGTLISFPVLLGLGYPALTANVANTVGIWPGCLGGVAGFGSEIGEQRGPPSGPWPRWPPSGRCGLCLGCRIFALLMAGWPDPRGGVRGLRRPGPAAPTLAR